VTGDVRRRRERCRFRSTGGARDPLEREIASSRARAGRGRSSIDARERLGAFRRDRHAEFREWEGRNAGVHEREVRSGTRARARGGAGTAGDGARVGAGWVAVVDVGVERGEREL
jgi:hypothetical protein|tara:strand:+ start:25968 stop:26312 length:345 start_codon:yes stop_codon:yes gene_type:complete